MNVYDQAHTLVTSIKESEEFKQYDEKKKQVEANPELNESIKDFMGQQFNLQAAQMMGQEMDSELLQKVQQLSAILMQDPLASQYLQCQMRFSMMMNDVFKIVGEVSDLGLDKVKGE